jgi:broad specificity phosphatase PhoE
VTLILVRHGRTAANASGLLLGRLDPELDAVGVAQADLVAAALSAGRGAGEDADAAAVRIISSPLLRALQTAERLGAPVEIDDRWIELDYGTYDGVPLADIPVEAWSTWRKDPTFAPPGGESLVDLGHRVRAALDDLAEVARDRDVIVVSHVSPIKAAVAWALGVGDEVAWRLFLAPASITRISMSDRGPSLHAFNVTTHLPAG